MIQVPETKDGLCFSRAVNRGQGTFTLVEQDVSAVKTIAFWIMQNIETAPSEKLHDALDTCLRWRHFLSRKSAD